MPDLNARLQIQRLSNCENLTPKVPSYGLGNVVCSAVKWRSLQRGLAEKLFEKLSENLFENLSENLSENLHAQHQHLLLLLRCRYPTTEYVAGQRLFWSEFVGCSCSVLVVPVQPFPARAFCSEWVCVCCHYGLRPSRSGSLCSMPLLQVRKVEEVSSSCVLIRAACLPTLPIECRQRCHPLLRGSSVTIALSLKKKTVALATWCVKHV